MKDQVWYNKLWRKKLDQLPVKGNADAAWTSMQQLLDVQMPVNVATTTAPMAKTLIAKIVTMAGYILPAAAMVGAVTWFAVKPPAMQKDLVKKHKETGQYSKVDSVKGSQTDLSTIDALSSDSDPVNNIASDSTLKNHNDTKAQPVGAAINMQLLEKNDPNDKIKPSQPYEDKSNVTLVGISVREHLNRPGANTAPANASLKNSENKKAINVLADRPASRSALARYGSVNAHRTVINKDKFGSMRGPQRSNLKGRSDNDLKGGGETNEPYQELKGYSKDLAMVKIQQRQDQFNPFLTNNVLNQVLANSRSLLLNDQHTTGSAPSAVANNKFNKNKQAKRIVIPYNYGIEAGLSAANKGTGFYAGVAGNYALTDKWLIGAALRYNSLRTLSGTYSHPSYYRPDSSAFTINDSRKIRAIDVPLTLEYKVNSLISLKAGAVISFAGKQSNSSYKLGTVANFRDTLQKSNTIDSALKNTVVNSKLGLGFTGGVSFNIKQFGIEARYLVMPPYKVSSSLGSYSQPYSSFQVGVNYWFRSGAKRSAASKLP